MFAKNAWIGFTKCRLLLMRIEEERMDAIRSHKNILTEKIDSIDYTHLLGYPSEVVAAEVITLVKEVANEYINKVVEQLEKASTEEGAEWVRLQRRGAVGLIPKTDMHSYGSSCYDRAIELVKGGGIDE